MLPPKNTPLAEDPEILSDSPRRNRDQRGALTLPTIAGLKLRP